MQIKPGEAVELQYTSTGRVTGLFPQARVLDLDGTVLDTVSLTALASPLDHVYRLSYTFPSVQGVYRVVYTPYTNSGHTTISEAELDAEESFEVIQIPNAPASFAGSAMPGAITENDIRDIARLVQKLLQDDFRRLMDMLLKIMEMLRSLPQNPKVDLTPVLGAIKALEPQISSQAMDKKEIEGIISSIQSLSANKPSVDMSGVEERMTKLANLIAGTKMPTLPPALERSVSNLTSDLKQIKIELGKKPADDKKAIKDVVDSLTKLNTLMAQQRTALFKMDELQIKRFQNLMTMLNEFFAKLSASQNKELAMVFQNLQNQIRVMSLANFNE